MQCVADGHSGPLLAHELEAGTGKMQKPNQGSEKKRRKPEMGVWRSIAWRNGTLAGYFRTKMGCSRALVQSIAPI
jgi:hypothetical protein